MQDSEFVSLPVVGFNELLQTERVPLARHWLSGKNGWHQYSFEYFKCKIWLLKNLKSYPLELPNLPEFSQYGAYGEDQVYTPVEVRAI